jgi:hypothetical protein
MDEQDALDITLDRTAGQVFVLDSASEQIGLRPGLAEIETDIDKLELSGGPADVVSFHDINVLKMAFEHVWERLYDKSTRYDVEQFYMELTRLYDDAGLQIPDFTSLKDVQDLQNFLSNLTSNASATAASDPPKSFVDMILGGFSFPGTPAAAPATPTEPGDDVAIPWHIADAFPEVIGIWPIMSVKQKASLDEQANKWLNGNPQQEKEAKDAAKMIIALAEAQLGRLGKLIAQLSNSLSKPYTFDVFAPGTYNYGIMLTYRQRWQPLTYQAGDLVASIPLAPGEVRKYSKRRVERKSWTTRQMERSMHGGSQQTSETGRAEWEIMKRASSASNFKMTSEGSFNIGIGSISSSSQFGANQASESADTKRQFHERTAKAAQEYRMERSLEVDSSESFEFDDTTSGEISNPNNELTVTYLFYELQRRYQVTEAIHRARPVILVARDMPSPHEITEAWAVEHQWIISRVLLDEMFRPALRYLSEGLAAQQISASVLKANFDTQRALVLKLEGEVSRQLDSREKLRDMVITTGQQMALAQATTMPTAAKVFTLGLAPDIGEMEASRLEASRAAAEARLKYAEEALADAQNKLKSASEALTYATREYADALKLQEKQSAIMLQFLTHLKDNIFHYMHAIWDYEHPDQRFFTLYDQMVKLPTAPTGSTATATPGNGSNVGASYGTMLNVNFSNAFNGSPLDRRLVEIADLDNPLGYKGNYTIFPLTEQLDITNFMMADFLDDYLKVRDPDGMGPWTVEKAEEWLQEQLADASIPQVTKDQYKKDFEAKLQEARRVNDEIIIPTGQLFIEALPGRHPLLEDFKLKHRMIDLKKATADLRHAELENLRLAVRTIKGHAKDDLLADPDIERNIMLQADLDAKIGP